uniref:Uncharacterized protein n=1 Tax=Mus musculus TaxID=10090 RepID=Q3UPA2_MOUSE|nr:unnamed protein product [Mus musculus]BAE25495.1 unnamed protein product [Mus musculus]
MLNLVSIIHLLLLISFACCRITRELSRRNLAKGVDGLLTSATQGGILQMPCNSVPIA